MMLYTEKDTSEDFFIQELQKPGWKHVNSENIRRKWETVRVLQNKIGKDIIIAGERR